LTLVQKRKPKNWVKIPQKERILGDFLCILTNLSL
jgi:hypothetical protein